jgi:hypothetical protein
MMCVERVYAMPRSPAELRKMEEEERRRRAVLWVAGGPIAAAALVSLARLAVLSPRLILRTVRAATHSGTSIKA